MWWCGCPTPPIPCEFITNLPCVDDANVYSMSVQMTNNDCTNCAAWSGDFDLVWDSGTSTWKSPASDTTSCGHTAGDPLWKMYFQTIGLSSYVVLEAMGLGYRWRVLRASWRCANENTLTYFTAIAPEPCNGRPDTITVTPCQFLCTPCGGISPATMTVTLSGFYDNAGIYCDCDFLNDSFILDPINGLSATDCRWEITGTSTLDCSLGLTLDYRITLRLYTIGSDVYANIQVYTASMSGGTPISTTTVNYEQVVGTTPLDCSLHYDVGWSSGGTTGGGACFNDGYTTTLAEIN